MDALEQAITNLEAELHRTMSSEGAVSRRCAAVAEILDQRVDPGLVETVLGTLAELLSQRAGRGAGALFDFVAGELRHLEQPGAIVMRLLSAADEGLRQRAALLAATLAREGRLEVGVPLLERVARIDEATPLSPGALEAVRELVGRLPTETAPGVRSPAEALVERAATKTLQRLGARLLDASGRPLEPAQLALRLGGQAAAFLAPYLEHSRAGWQELVALTPEPGKPPPCLEGLQLAEQTLGAPLLREVVGRLGWPRLNCGFSSEARVALSIGGGFPLVVTPAQARLVAGAVETETLWRRQLVIAHGGRLASDEGPTSDAAVERFRGYNVAHAELLDEILAVAPLDETKVRRIFSLMDRVVADFAALFGSASEDARRVRELHQRLRRLAEADLEHDRPRGSLSGETVRRIQMFEDPARLDDVTTLHGLKRYLHQKGLTLAFGLFRSQQGADRSVDLLVSGERELLRCEQPIRYLEFEPTPPVGPARLPYVVSMLARGLGRQLLLGRKLPTVTLLGFGNELQLHVYYRNHPAFIRIDLSPPRRGGMIDLEYYAVSQYEMGQHPDLSLQAIQRVLGELDFDVSKVGLRLRARYDKERAVDLGDIVVKAAALFELLPYLMDVDWLIGDLDYPQAARPEVAAAWAGFFARWAAIPAVETLSADRRKIVMAVEPDPAGPREVVWDGRGAYRDRFSGKPAAGLDARLHAELERRGLASLLPATPSSGTSLDQRSLDQWLLEPLAEAVQRGEVRDTPSGLRPAPPEVFQREHEAERLAAILAEGGPSLAHALQMASLARAVERQTRFRTTGSIHGHAVQAASLPTAPHAVGLFVLRDAHGITRLAVAAAGGVLYRTRSAAHGAWREGDELTVTELARLLRSCNYLAAGEGAAAPTPEELAAVREGFAKPHPSPVARLSAGERLVPAAMAAPGRATGFACFRTAGRRPADLDDAVLLAPAIRPEDAPWLRHAAGIVSTGGGILSHVGLIALELEKPAAIVEGRWSRSASGAEVLYLHRPLWREAESCVAGLQVVCRHGQRDIEEALEQGDLVCVDGETESLLVLGHDPQALMLHRGLKQLEAAATELTATRTDPEILACRGRLYRALHQLERLLSRLESPGLARHAVRELLSLPRVPLAPEGGQGRRRLLATLLANPACAAEARQAVGGRLDDLQARLAATTRAVVDDLPHLRHPAEVLCARLGVRRIEETLADARETSQAQATRGPAAADILDSACRRRLLSMRVGLATRAAERLGSDEGRWPLRQLLPGLEQLDRVLTGEPAHGPWAEQVAALRRGDALRLRELASRRVLRGSDGGAELVPLAGGKAANLGEIERVLGATAVPPWFAITDAAFRELLETKLPAPLQEALGLGAAARLQDAIVQVMAQPAGDARRQAAAIRELWQAVPLPADLADEAAAAYHALASEPGEDPAVAIRSSGLEEDACASTLAGQFDTFLFVRGAAAVLEHLKLAWAGFWTERAIDARRFLGAAPLARGGGIVIQRMVDARAAGVLHTVSAAAGQLREMVVNVGLGLGAGVVSGTVEVDHILVSKDAGLDSGELQLRYRVGDKRQRVVCDEARGGGTRREETRYHQRLRAALEYVELVELVRAASRLETAFGQPLDVEFAIDGRDLRILQARPIPVFDAAWRQTLSRHPLCTAEAPSQ